MEEILEAETGKRAGRRECEGSNHELNPSIREAATRLCSPDREVSPLNEHFDAAVQLSLIHISEPTRLDVI
eukprot:4922601-Prorocentrum_lima.AAC.1